MVGPLHFPKQGMRAQTPGGFHGQGLQRMGEGGSEAETDEERELGTGETRREIH